MFNFSLERMLLTIPAIIIAFSFHEFAHAFVSDRLGDPTPRNQGRLTLSPLAHIDIIGFILILLMGFGWAKPVQVNPRYYKNPKRDNILVSVAGPVTNLMIAFIFTFLLKLTFSYYISENTVILNLLKMMDYVIRINIMLFLFNLIPIPPLDGYHILSEIIPSRNYKILAFIEQYSSIILILIIITPVVSYVIGPPLNFIYGLFLRIFGI
jgi:Zn-dependent protease